MSIGSPLAASEPANANASAMDRRVLDRKRVDRTSRGSLGTRLEVRDPPNVLCRFLGSCVRAMEFAVGRVGSEFSHAECVLRGCGILLPPTKSEKGPWKEASRWFFADKC